MRSLIAVAFVATLALAAAPAHAREVWAPHGSTAVAVFDSAGGAATVPPGLAGLPAPRELAFTPDAARFYLSSATASTDLITGSVPAHTASSVPGTGGASGQDNPVVSPDGTRAYVIEQFDLLAIDTATNTVVDREFVTGSPGGVAVSVDGAKVFVGDGGASGIYVYDTASGTCPPAPCTRRAITRPTSRSHLTARRSWRRTARLRPAR